MIPLILGITLITFFVIRLAPGNPTFYQGAFNPKVKPEAVKRLEKIYGLDKPLPIQYLNWLKRLVNLDFGRSFVDGKPVIQKIKERITITIMLNLLALVLILIISIPLNASPRLRSMKYLKPSQVP